MCILGMWMLTWMFQQATASFSLANAQATLTGQERMVTTIMTRDLEADKFPDDDRFAPNRRRRLSDQMAGFAAPRGGYFWARSLPPDRTAGPTTLNFEEATDTYGFNSSRSANHFIQFTAILPDTPGNRFVAEVPATSGTTHAGSAAEISYYLVRNGQTSTGVALYDLMRVQRIVAISPYDAKDYLRNAVAPAYAQTPTRDLVEEVMVCSPGVMHTLADLAAATGAGAPRFTPGTARSLTTTPPSRRLGEDRLMSNVLSFEVKFTGPTVGFNPTPVAWPADPTSPNMWPRPFSPGTPPSTYQGNSDWPYDNLPFDGQYDTSAPFGTTTGAGTRQPIRITGAQIRIRALFGTTARQTTIVVTP
jgi:hypothetical protein